MSFLGGLHGIYGLDVRTQLAKDCLAVGEPTCKYIPLSSETSHHGTRCTFCDIKQSSIFCAEPGGDSPYRKSLSDDLLSGCIPVIFSPYLLLNNQWHWDFRNDSSVYIDGVEYSKGNVNLFEILSKVAASDRVIELRKTIAKHAHQFLYSIDDYPGDAVDVTVRSLDENARKREAREGLKWKY
jgi:hypothetical protein